MKTYTEKQAVAALKRIAKRWPPHLTLVAMGGLQVVRDLKHTDREHLDHEVWGTCIAQIDIPCEGGDMLFEHDEPRGAETEEGV